MFLKCRCRIEGLLVISCDIYVPKKEDAQMFNQVNKILGDMDGHIILDGGFN